MNALTPAHVESLLRTNPDVAAIDIHLARLLQRLAGKEDPLLFLSAALASSQTRAGHTCLDLKLVARQEFVRETFGELLPATGGDLSGALLSALQAAPVVGRPGDYQPLILDDAQRLYLKRYWDYQEKLARFARNRAGRTETLSDASRAAASLDAHFPDHPDGIDWQKTAAAVALLKPFTIITGGPGTGKTHAVARILSVLLELHTGPTLRIRMAAPTGKAAIRLQQSISAVKKHLPSSDAVKAAIPEAASTVHRLLGYRRFSSQFKHDANNQLELDVLVVDEASMVDLAMMAKLVDALPDHARLILLGDDHQLASVEAGAVLADLCGDGQERFTPAFAGQLEQLTGQPETGQHAAADGNPLQDCVVHLQKSYRFDPQKGIGALSRAVNSGDAAQALHLLKSDDTPEVRWHCLEQMAAFHAEIPGELISPPSRPDPDSALHALGRMRILGALRDGPQGVRTVNTRIERTARQKTRQTFAGRWYAGQPLLIQHNDYSLNLFNGDLGVVLPDPDETGSLRTYFPAGESGFRSFRPFRLPEHETAYAMTVHKSQGSEFDRVILLLPEQDSPVLSRELLYTAITRAAVEVDIWGDEDIFAAAVERKTQRSSGLRDALWAG